MGFLLSEPKSTTCCRLPEIIAISHDSVNRFLLRETYEPEDLFNEAKSNINLVGGTLSVDDSVFVTGDSWYSGVNNLKTVKNHGLGLLFARESNRLVSIEKDQWIQVQKRDIPDEG